MKHRIYETVLTGGLKDLKAMLEEVISEERKMHETLKKYKKDNTTLQSLTDYEKLLVQYHVDMRELKA